MDHVIVIEKAIELNKVIVETTLDDTKALSKEQKDILFVAFEKVKDSVESILIDMDVSEHVKIIQIISCVMKVVEGLAVLHKQIAGIDKKVIALECGRKCIQMMVKDHLTMLLLYDLIAESTMETMIDVSRTINKMEIVTGCCVDIIGRFGK